ncbi:hypothetical protein ACFSQ3_15650 [Sphingobacterium corticis]|uniref:HEAT repeat domain-containing protein n=1 Tax=Sphingobacterium corticis TaxID=1812823 RepID=A0ABW5NQP0_9SPHI
MEDKLKKFVSENRRAFDNKQPSPLVWDRIKQELPKTESEIPVKQIRSKRFWYAAASVIAFLTVSGIIWKQLDIAKNKSVEETRLANHEHSPQKNDVQVQIEEKETSNEGNQSAEHRIADGYTSNHAEYAVSQQSVTHDDHQMGTYASNDPLKKSLALLDDESSTMNRMDGVMQLASLEEVPDEAMVKIQHLMNNDANENVRIAAYDLFVEHASLHQKEQQMQDIFLQQNDPAMQMELMQAMAKTDSLQLNDETTRRLETIAQDPLAIDLVKEQAYAVLMKNW